MFVGLSFKAVKSQRIKKIRRDLYKKEWKTTLARFHSRKSDTRNNWNLRAKPRVNSSTCTINDHFFLIVKQITPETTVSESLARSPIELNETPRENRMYNQPRSKLPSPHTYSHQNGSYRYKLKNNSAPVDLKVGNVAMTTSRLYKFHVNKATLTKGTESQDNSWLIKKGLKLSIVNYLHACLIFGVGLMRNFVFI